MACGKRKREVEGGGDRTITCSKNAVEPFLERKKEAVVGEAQWLSAQTPRDITEKLNEPGRKGTSQVLKEARVGMMQCEKESKWPSRSKHEEERRWKVWARRTVKEECIISRRPELNGGRGADDKAVA